MSTQTADDLARARMDAARADARAKSIQFKHSYRMSRLAAEREAIESRLSKNFWRSRYVRRAAYGLFLLTGVAIGVAAAYHWPGSGRSTGGMAPAPAVAEALPAPAPTADAMDAVSEQRGAGQAAEGVVDPTLQINQPDSLTVVDSVDVPFVRSLSRLGKAGVAAAEQFARVNKSAPKFQVTGVYGVGESEALAAARALAVVDALVSFGVDRKAVEVMPVMASMDAENIRSGARLASLGPLMRDAKSIKPGAPLGAIADDGDKTLTPAFPLTGAPTPIRPTSDTGFERLAATEPRAKAKTEEEEGAGAKELAEAVKAAASRQRADKTQPKVKAQAPVNVKLAPKQQPEQTPKDQKPTDEPKADATVDSLDGAKAQAYTVVSKLDDAVLVKVGREVWYVKVGQKLPDGKLLGPDLEPQAQ